jgi:hypothetical protein
VKNLFIAIAALTFSTAASASYLESCAIKATVVETEFAPELGATVQEYTPLVKIKIESAVNQGSHNPAACDAKVGTEVWMISKAVTPIVVSQELKLDYFYANSRGPDGVVQSERWTILD